MLIVNPTAIAIISQVRDSFLATLKAEYARMYPGDRQVGIFLAHFQFEDIFVMLLPSTHVFCRVV